MTFDEFRNLDLRDVDLSNVGEWSALAKGIVVALLLILIFAFGYFAVVKSQLKTLSASRQEEVVLKHRFQHQQHLAAGFNEYKQQLKEMRHSFGKLLSRLPSKSEIDQLLRNISQTAQQDGLSQKLFQPQREISKGFYAEKPIRMEYTGGFQQIAKFVSDVSHLPRIVTLGNFSLTPVKSGDGAKLRFSLTGVTYRYLGGGIHKQNTSGGHK